MPVVFDQVVGTVDPPSPEGSAAPSPPETASPPAAARQLFEQMLRDREKRAARVRAD